MGIMQSKRGRHGRLRMTFAAIAGLGVPGLVEASQYNFTGPSAGNWNVASSWTLVGGSTHQIPINGDDAFLGVSGTTAVSSYYTQTYTGAGLNSLNIDSANGSNPFTFYQVTAGYAMVAGTENVGITGSNAIYNESIGSNTATTLNLGTQSTGAGTYLLSASGTLSTTEEAIGAGGTGSFIQNGGTNTITVPVSGETTTAGNLYIGASGSSTGSTYTLNGGNLNLSNGAFLFDGGGSPYVSTNAPKGVLIQNGGVINLSGYAAMWVGASSASSGSRYDLSASGQLTGGQGIEVGQNCTAAVDQSGGSINTQDIALGSYGTGIYNLSSGSATLAYEIIGQSGNGIVQQSGGVQTVTGGGGFGLNIGFVSGLGIFNLSAGTVNSLGITQIGGGNSYNPGNGTGLLNIWGTGNMNLGGGGLVVSTTGPGSVNQSGGTVSTSSLQIATANYSGSYLFSAGSALTVLGSETIGVACAGTFTQTGGTHIVGSELILSSASGVTSSLNLSGGVLSVGDSVTVGNAGTGSITQNGGIFNVSNTLYISNLAGSVGSFALQSGILSAGSVYVGYSGTGSFLQTGGSLNVSNGLFVGSITPATYTLNGGALNLPANPTAGLQGNIFYQSNFYQSGGSVSGTLNNSGNYYFTGGTFPGMFANGESGYASFSSAVSFGAGFSNLGTVVIQSTVSLGTAAGQTLLNQGQINAYSAQLNSAGPIVNDGSIYITGLLGGTGGMTNNALITQGSGFLSIAFTNAAPLVNNGTIELAANLTTSISGTLNNAGTFATNGAFVTGSGLLANVIGGTINGPGMIATSFSNAGIVVPGTGTLNIASNWNNSGAVELTAVTSTITGGAINNLGTIQGFGCVGSNVNNSRGTVNALGGTLLIGGTLTNPAAGTISASSGNEVLVNSGLMTNAGLISLTGGTYDNGGYNLSNTGQITGYGTLRTGGLVNSGIFTLSGTGTNGTTTVNGNVTNNTAINIRYQLAIFTGNIVNLGTITTFGTTVTFSGTYTGNNYVSDPSSNIFQNSVTTLPGGTMTGGVGDVYDFLGSSVINNGTFTNAGRLTSSDLFTNNFAFNQSGPQSWAVGTLFTNTAGTAVFATDAGAGGQNLTVNASGGTVIFSSTQHLAALNISAGALMQVTGGGNGNRSTLFTKALGDAGTLDLTDNYLDVQGGSLESVTALVKQGFDGGLWTGAGINSSAAASDTAHLTALGTISNGTDVLVHYTYYGDTNLDGKVDGSDYSRLDNGFTSMGVMTGWFNGDFNYDGAINGSDYTLIDNTFNQQGAHLTAAVATAEIARPQIGATSSVPEPSTMLAFAGGMAIFLGRRRAK